ncbi:transcriptional regulator, TetR family [Pseudoxanthobacter soli DSM 19599]|uniref:Transcriptional regulator, TetR family n=1 Tax=Pseudoxanthobacter soli DSM 19599 TaxID=1123029 RepID=A0A1M7ZN65_9HYPH|nr:TetR/AcrR family transcriptional regulator [Pseudoxanthobacter soli]SHO66348.1 transcriptional regulator, TetR family [Pseudoxanthobacter soli DSM 19599]
MTTDLALETPAKEGRTRNPDATRKRILKAAKDEFARRGLGGARIDTIAAKAKANKGMIYHYFGNKEDLFRIVLEEAYADIRNAERKLDLDKLDPEEAMTRLVEFTWKYYLANPEFLTLVNSENLHKGRHIAASESIREMHRPFVGLVQLILDRGVEAGVFRPGIDAINLNITIAAIGYYYLTNRFTGSVIFETDLTSKERLQERLAFNIDTILRLVRK